MTTAATASRQTSAGSYRTELHGLRATAILMVATYHIWFGRVSGGIDIFLLISSFLLMQTFLRRIDNDRPLQILGYWAKAFRRLLPPAVITVLGTLALAYVFFPEWRWRGVINEAFASLGYYENWYLALSSADYYADKLSVSPLQHFWSLAIQGQIFLLWPALIALAVGLAKFSHTRAHGWLWGIFGSIFAGSLCWSIYQTFTAQAFAYFSTFTRLWEFALGALLALALPKIEGHFGYGPGVTERPSVFNRVVRVVMGWVGIILVLSCGFVVDVQGQFPGYIALWPTLAASLVIIAGHTHSQFGVDRILSAKIFQKLGDYSYALYLVHWPFLITMIQITGIPQLDFAAGALTLAGSIIFAGVLTTRVDAPIRYSKWANARRRRSVLIIATALVIGLIPTGGLNEYLNYESRKAAAEQVDKAAGSSNDYRNYSANNPGAKILYRTDIAEPDPEANTLSLLADLHDDWVSIGDPCDPNLGLDLGDIQGGCGQISRRPNDQNIFIIGSSRMQQYSEAFITVGAHYDWNIVSLLAGGCTFTSQDSVDAAVIGLAGVERAYCHDFNQMGLDYIAKYHPDMVIMIATIVDLEGKETLLPGFNELAEQLTSEGIDVLAIRDMPRVPFQPAQCISEKSVETCSYLRSETYAPFSPLTEIQINPYNPGRVYTADTSNLICPGEICPMVIGNVYVYLDKFHLSGTYSATMDEFYVDQLDAQGYKPRG